MGLIIKLRIMQLRFHRSHDTAGTTKRHRAALPLLWDRMTGQVPVLCLATLSVPNQGSSC